MSKIKPLPIAEFEPQIKGLIDQLFFSNLHFQIGTGLRESWREYYKEIVGSHVFWQFTIQAHDTMAVLGLCRVYDGSKIADKKCLTLRRFITTVETNPGIFKESEFRKRLEKNPHVESLSRQLDKLDGNRIKMDKAFCDDDKSVKHLHELRNNVIAHLNYEYAIGKNKNWSKSNPLPYSDIKKLISQGFDIVNRYSGIFIANTHTDRLMSKQDEDYLEVLKSLRKLRSQENSPEL